MRMCLRRQLGLVNGSRKYLSCHENVNYNQLFQDIKEEYLVIVSIGICV